MLKSQKFYISSKNKVSGSSTNFFHSLKNINVDNEYDHVSMLGCVIPKSYYLIDSRHNTMTVVEDDKTYDVTIPIGNYAFDKAQNIILSPPGFRDTIEGLLNTGSSTSGNSYTYSVVANQRTGKYEFTVSGNGGVQPTFEFSFRLGKIMGFEEGVETFVSDSLTSTQICNFQHTNSILIKSDIVDDPSGVLQEVYSSTTDFTNITYDSKELIYHSKKIKNRNSNTISITIEDFDDNEILDLNGLDVSVSLIFFKKDDSQLVLAKDALLKNMEKDLETIIKENALINK